MGALKRDVFQALADPTRRGILTLIANNSMNVNSIAENFEMSRPAISQHVKILSESGLVVIRKKGRHRYCELQVEKFSEVDKWLEPFREIWESRFDDLDNLLDNLKNNQ